MCASGQYMERGIKGLHGFDAQFVVDDEKYIIKIPPSIRNIAVLTEPATVVEKAIDHACRLQTTRLPIDPDSKKWLHGKLVLVAGLGTIGLLASMILRLRGARVLGMDIADPQSLRPRLLAAMGGHYIKSSDQAIHTAIKTYGFFDMIVEAAGIPKLDFELIEALGNNGVYVLTGVPGDSHLLNVNAGSMMKQLVLKNQLLFGSVNAGYAHFKQAVLDLEEAEKKWPQTIGQLITSKTPFAEYASVLLHRKPDEIKAVIEWAS